MVVALAVGTRHLLTDGVPSFGQFLPFDPSPRGGAFLYFLTASGGAIEKKPVDPAIVK
mgnify:CR=1 FL=1